jgi:hypothetical protein
MLLPFFRRAIAVFPLAPRANRPKKELITPSEESKPIAPNCRICGSDLKLAPDVVVLCEHKGGLVHAGCCAANCSLDKQGHVNCRHAKHAFDKCEITIDEK